MKRITSVFMMLVLIFSVSFLCPVESSAASKSTPTASLSVTSYTYNGKVKKPTVTVKNKSGKKLTKDKHYTVSYSKGRKNVGKYTVTVTYKGSYSGKKKLYFTVNPKSTSISSLKEGDGKVTVKWKKQASQTTGYQIQYSTSSKFKSAKTTTISSNKTTSKAISGLSNGKKYYFRIRTYKTVTFNNKKIKVYSSWSKAKVATPRVISKKYSFVLNTDTMCFHASADCRAAKKILPENKSTMTGTVEKVKSYGYKACGICAKGLK